MSHFKIYTVHRECWDGCCSSRDTYCNKDGVPLTQTYTDYTHAYWTEETRDRVFSDDEDVLEYILETEEKKKVYLLDEREPFDKEELKEYDYIIKEVKLESDKQIAWVPIQYDYKYQIMDKDFNPFLEQLFNHHSEALLYLVEKVYWHTVSL